MKKHVTLLLIFIIIVSACNSKKWNETSKGSYVVVTNEGGQTLGYSQSSGVKLLTVEGWAFKDLSKNGKLDRYEDWRLSYDERAQDLASQLTIEEIGGLMLYSSHQSIPARPAGYFAGTYDGKPFQEGVTDPSSLSDQQKAFLEKDNLRHVLVTTVQSPSIAAQWSNKLQAFCEGLAKGIPANNSSDPRHGTDAKAEYNAAAGGDISMWPSSLGMAATFDPAVVKKFGEIAAKEYRALGISTALSPQIDIATEPRWLRFNGTFGESPKLSAAMAVAYCDGFQTSAGADEIANGWGYASVNAMVKHWPGGGSGESGRDAHYGSGKFAVYPGNNFNDHLIPFLEGAFKLAGPTKSAAAVMPYYTISWKQDKQNGEEVGNSYSKFLVGDLLRDKYQYDGVICTDWNITHDHRAMDSFIDGKPWGVENLSEGERHYKLIKNGVDQFGGNNDLKPVLEAYRLGVTEIGEEKMRARMEQSAVRLLRNIFRTGLFENPYVDPAATDAVVGSPEFMKAGFDAQLKSVVMLKNHDKTLPLKEKAKAYIPRRFVPASRNFLGMELPETNDYPVNMEIAKKYFEITDDPGQADVALVFIVNPSTGIGYDAADLKKGGNGYIPISLQYRPYKAVDARAKSIAGGDPLEKSSDRNYKGKIVSASNVTDADLVNQTKLKMKDKPVVVVMNASNPMIFSEIESLTSALLTHFGVQDQAVFEILSGKAEPSGLLPMQMPASMSVVEKQAEDVPFDMDCYSDADGNRYDFAFGLNWNGVIADDRVKKYR